MVIQVQDGYAIIDGEKFKLWKEPTHEEEMRYATSRALSICARYMAGSRGILSPEHGRTPSVYTEENMIKEVETAFNDYNILPEDEKRIIKRVKKEFNYSESD